MGNFDENKRRLSIASLRALSHLVVPPSRFWFKMHQPAATLALSSAVSVRGVFKRPVVVRKASARSARASPVALFGFGKKKEEAATGDEYTVTYCQNW
jgi:hypothetical protein